MKKKVRGYIFSRPFMGERVPQYVQNIVLRDYCQKENLSFLLSLVEYSMPNSSIVLNQALTELDKIDGIIAYSVFQLPQKNEQRSNLYNIILKNHKSIYFALEGFSATKLSDFAYIEDLWAIKIALPYTLNVSSTLINQSLSHE